jgi:hypothetical protein
MDLQGIADRACTAGDPQKFHANHRPLAAELSLRTFWTLLRELSSRRRRLPIVLEELSAV